MFSRQHIQTIVGVCLVAVLVMLVGVAVADARLPAPPVEDPSKGQAPDVTPEPPVLDQRVVNEGEAFELTLEANATTGYTWEVADIAEDIVQLTGSEYIPDPNPERLCGVGGKSVFRFQAMGKGRTTLKLVYHRPWEKDVEPLETYIVEITVR